MSLIFNLTVKIEDVREDREKEKERKARGYKTPSRGVKITGVPHTTRCVAKSYSERYGVIEMPQRGFEQ